MEKRLAEESEKTNRARAKLEKNLAIFDAQVTKQALGRKSYEIHRWIERNAHMRIPLKSKAIALFDENQSSAEESKKISSLAQNLKNLVDSKIVVE